MARLKRITNKIFGSTASPDGDSTNGAYIGQFGSAKLGTYNATDNVEEIQALSAWNNGWIDAVIPNQQYPTLPEMTGVGKVLSYQTGYLHQEGVSEWDANTEYYENSIVKYASNTVTQTATGSIGDSTGITAVTVNSATFLSQISYDGVYTFTFDGSDWYYNGIITDITLYGLSVTGTAVVDDEIIVTVTTTITYNEQAKLYISLVDNNINIIPTSDTTKWALFIDGLNFADKDLSNLSATGKTKVVNLANELDWANAITVSTTSDKLNTQTYTPTTDGMFFIQSYVEGGNSAKACSAYIINNKILSTNHLHGNSSGGTSNYFANSSCCYAKSGVQITYAMYYEGTASYKECQATFVPFKKS